MDDIVKEINEFFERETHRNLITAVRSKLGEEFSKKITEHLTEYGRQLTFKSSVKAFKKVFKGCNTHKFVLINVNGGNDDIEVIGHGDTIMGIVYNLVTKQVRVIDGNDKYKDKTIAEYCEEHCKPSGVKKGKAPMHVIIPLSQPEYNEYTVNDVKSIDINSLIQTASTNKTASTNQTTNTTQRVTDLGIDELLKKDGVDDERSGVFHTEKDKMRIINEEKKKSRIRSSSDEKLSVNQANTAQPAQPVQPANNVQQVNIVQKVARNEIKSLSMQSPLSTQSILLPRWSDNQSGHLKYVQGLLERIMNRNETSEVMKIIAGIIKHFDIALEINIRNPFVMRRKIDNFMAEIEKHYVVMIDIFAKLSKYAAKINDEYAHSAIFDLIVEIREKINKLSERTRGCTRIVNMQIKINELSDEYYIKYEPNNKDINLLDQY